MQNKYGPLVVTIVAAVGSFLLSHVLWPDPVGAMAPMGLQLPLFIGIAVAESLAFGAGVAFLIFGFSFMHGRGAGAWAAFLATAWLLVSWWPHDNMHRVNGMTDYNGLLRIEYTFHVTLIIAGFILASYLWKQFSLAPKTQ